MDHYLALAYLRTEVFSLISLFKQPSLLASFSSLPIIIITPIIYHRTLLNDSFFCVVLIARFLFGSFLLHHLFRQPSKNHLAQNFLPNLSRSSISTELLFLSLPRPSCFPAPGTKLDLPNDLVVFFFLLGVREHFCRSRAPTSPTEELNPDPFPQQLQNLKQKFFDSQNRIL